MTVLKLIGPFILVLCTSISCKPKQDGSSLEGSYTNPKDPKACGGEFIIPDPEGNFFKTKSNLPAGGIPYFGSRTSTTPLGYIAAHNQNDQTTIIPVTLRDSQCRDTFKDSTSTSEHSPSKCIYMQVANDNGIAYSDKYLSTSLSRVGKGIPVTRELTVDHDNGRTAMRVNVRGGALQNQVVWMDGSNLIERDDSNLCKDTTSLSLAAPSDQRCRYDIRGGTEADKQVWLDSNHLEKRVQTWPNPECTVELISDDHWSNHFGAGKTLDNFWASTGKSALLCIPSLGEGFLASGGGLIQGIGALLKAGGTRYVKNVKWTADLILATGSSEARKRLRQTWKDDKTKAQYAIAGIKDAIPSIHLYLSHASQQYGRLSPNQQSVVLCKVMGSLAFDVITAIVGVHLVKAVQASKSAKLSSAIAKIDDVAGALVKIDNSPLDETAAAAQKARNTTKAVAGAAFDPKKPVNWTSQSVKEWAEKLQSICSGAAHKCSGSPLGATKEEILKNLKHSAATLQQASADSALDATSRKAASDAYRAVIQKVKQVK